MVVPGSNPSKFLIGSGWYFWIAISHDRFTIHAGVAGSRSFIFIHPADLYDKAAEFTTAVSIASATSDRPLYFSDSGYRVSGSRLDGWVKKA